MNEGKIIQMLLKHDDDINQKMVTKGEFRKSQNTLLETMDEMIGMLHRVETEITMHTHAGLRREERIEILESDMVRVKGRLHMT